MMDEPMDGQADDLNDHEKMIADAARRMQAKGVSTNEIGGFIQRAQERLAQNEAERPLSRGQLAKGMARGVAQGLTFNFADELEGLARGALTDETVDQATERVRGEQNEFRQKEPALSIASEIAGSVVPGLGAARLVTSGAKGARIAGRIAASGAGAGALAGAGAGEGGPGGRILPAAAGAATGAALGYVGGKAIDGAQRLLPKAKGVITRIAGGVAADATDVAPTHGARKVLSALENSGKSVDDLANAAADSPETMVVDVLGKPGARQARGIRTLGGKPGEAIEETMANRQQGQQGRIVKRIYGTRGAEDVFKTADELAEQQAVAAKPLYDAAHAHGAVDDEAINKILANSEVGKLWRDAEKIAQQEALASELGGDPSGYVMPTIESITKKAGPLVDASGANIAQEVVSKKAVPDVKALDYLKQAMDDKVEALAAQPNARRAMMNLRERLLNRMDEIVPNYNAARKVYAGKARLREALENGKDAFRSDMDPREITRVMQDMSGSERELYQRGAIDALRTRVENLGDNRNAAALFNNTGFRKRITAVYGKEADDVLKTLAAEMKMAETGNFIRGGSNTADKAADAMDVGTEAGDAIQHIVGGIGFGPGAAIRRTLGSLAMGPVRRSIAGVTEASRGELANALTTKVADKAAMDPFVQMLRTLQAQRPAQQAGRAVAGNAAGAATGRLFGQR